MSKNPVMVFSRELAHFLTVTVTGLQEQADFINQVYVFEKDLKPIFAPLANKIRQLPGITDCPNDSILFMEFIASSAVWNQKFLCQHDLLQTIREYCKSIDTENSPEFRKQVDLLSEFAAPIYAIKHMLNKINSIINGKQLKFIDSGQLEAIHLAIHELAIAMKANA